MLDKIIIMLITMLATLLISIPFVYSNGMMALERRMSRYIKTRETEGKQFNANWHKGFMIHKMAIYIVIGVFIWMRYDLRTGIYMALLATLIEMFIYDGGINYVRGYGFWKLKASLDHPGDWDIIWIKLDKWLGNYHVFKLLLIVIVIAGYLFQLENIFINLFNLLF